MLFERLHPPTPVGLPISIKKMLFQKIKGVTIIMTMRWTTFIAVCMLDRGTVCTSITYVKIHGTDREPKPGGQWISQAE